MDKTRKTLKFQGNAKDQPRTDMATMYEKKCGKTVPQANKEEKLPWTSVWDNQGIAKSKFGVQAIPSVWLVDKNGRVIFSHKWGDSIGMCLRELFGSE